MAALEEEKQKLTTIFAVRTTIGQEKSVANMIFGRLRLRDPVPDIKAVLTADQFRGYVFIEAIQQNDVQESISGIRHVKGKIVGSIKLIDLANVIAPRKVTEILEEGDIVEIVSGIFQNRRAIIERMPREGAKEEVVVRLTDSDSPISIKVHGDYLKLIEKGQPGAPGVPAPVATGPRAPAPAVQMSEGNDLDIFASMEKEMGLLEDENGEPLPPSSPSSPTIELESEPGLATAGADEADVFAAEQDEEEEQERLERRRKSSDSGKSLFFDDEDEEDWTEMKEDEDEDTY
ncbi:MAG TPA: transcription elongation factor Spt5 [Candidatus Lokiarchaeia archaeon]|nr:transcription elongation factor Spt5 [Candidatus Lokiarchaeia archaeon]